MPKVSEQYRDARRAEILDAARRCFLRNGFHETSMQDLFAESGLSSGAVYSYFPSKDDMILALAEENMRDAVAMIRTPASRADHSGGVGEIVAAVLELVRARHEQDGTGAMTVLVWAECLRNPALTRRFDALLRRLRTEMSEVMRQHRSAGSLPPDIDPEAVARLVLTVVPGYILQMALFGSRAVDGVPEAARALWSG